MTDVDECAGEVRADQVEGPLSAGEVHPQMSTRTIEPRGVLPNRAILHQLMTAGERLAEDPGEFVAFADDRSTDFVEHVRGHEPSSVSDVEITGWPEPFGMVMIEALVAGPRWSRFPKGATEIITSGAMDSWAIPRMFSSTLSGGSETSIAEHAVTRCCSVSALPT